MSKVIFLIVSMFFLVSCNSNKHYSSKSNVIELLYAYHETNYIDNNNKTYKHYVIEIYEGLLVLNKEFNTDECLYTAICKSNYDSDYISFPYKFIEAEKKDKQITYTIELLQYNYRMKINYSLEYNIFDIKPDDEWNVKYFHRDNLGEIKSLLNIGDATFKTFDVDIKVFRVTKGFLVTNNRLRKLVDNNKRIEYIKSNQINKLMFSVSYPMKNEKTEISINDSDENISIKNKIVEIIKTETQFINILHAITDKNRKEVQIFFKDLISVARTEGGAHNEIAEFFVKIIQGPRIGGDMKYYITIEK